MPSSSKRSLDRKKRKRPNLRALSFFAGGISIDAMYLMDEEGREANYRKKKGRRLVLFIRP